MATAKCFSLGETVKSKPCGKRAAFVGEIHYVGHSYYHVRDSYGESWHRDDSDLSVVKSEEGM